MKRFSYGLGACSAGTPARRAGDVAGRPRVRTWGIDALVKQTAVELGDSSEVRPVGDHHPLAPLDANEMP